MNKCMRHPKFEDFLSKDANLTKCLLCLTYLKRKVEDEAEAQNHAQAYCFTFGVVYPDQDVRTSVRPIANSGGRRAMFCGGRSVT